MLRLSVLGQTGLRKADDTDVRSLMAQPKTLAVLAYLLLARPRGFHRRESLCALFWPESDESHARGALSQALSRIRRSLEKDVLETRGQDEVRVAPGGVACDAIDFEDAVESKRWEDAFQIYRGPLLHGLLIPEADGFQRWLDMERGRIQEMAATAAWAVALERLGAGAFLESQRAAQRALELDPAREGQVRDYMVALAGAGDRGGALRFYERLAELLAAELQVEPSPETAAAAAEIRTGSLNGHGAIPGHPPSNGAAGSAVSGLEPLPAPAPSGEAGRVDHHPTPRNRPRRWLIPGAGVAALVLVLGYGEVVDRWIGAPGTLFWNRQAGWYATVVVADFRAPFDPPLGRLASDCLKIALDQSSLVRPVPHQSVARALVRMRRNPVLDVDEDTAHEVAERDGHALVVVGDMEDVGQGYLLTARLEAAGTREALGQFRAVAGDLDELLPALDRLAADIRSRIGDSRRSIRISPPLERVTTHSLPALRLYTRAERIRVSGGDPWEAVPLLREATALDPGFAMAYRQWGKILNSYLTQWEKQAELSRLAYGHRERLTDYERLLVEAAHVFGMPLERTPGGPPPSACDRWGPVLRLYQDYVRRHPNDLRPLQNLGYNLDRMGRFQEAEEVYRRGVGLAPTVGLYNNLVMSHLRQGERGEAMAVLREWRDRFGEDVWWLLALGSDADRRRDYRALDSIYQVYEERTYGLDSHFWLARGRLEAVRGHLGRGEEYFRRAIEAMEEREDFVAPVPWIADLGLMRLVARGDSARVTRGVPDAVDRVPPDQSLEGAWVNVGLLYALAGEVSKAREAGDRLGAIGYFGAGIFQAGLALAEDRPEESLRILQDSDSPCEGNPGADHRMDRRWRRVLAGRAYETLGDVDNAISEYEAYFTEPPRAPLMNLDAIFLFDTLERLGRLHETRGDRAAAASYYRRAADQWGDADPDLQPRVRKVREAAVRLTGT